MKAHRHKTFAFTIPELLAVVTVVGAMALLSSADAARGKINSKTARCLANLQQQGMALEMYAADHRNFLPAPYVSQETSARGLWLGGNISLDYTNKRENWDARTAFSKSVVQPYFRSNYSVWKCPADLTKVRSTLNGLYIPRVRTYSMNHAFGDGSWLPNTKYRTFSKTTDIPTPSSIWTVMDEHPDSLNDGSLAVQMAEPGSKTAQIIDYPGSHHAGAAGLVYADGHVENHLWRSAKMRPPIRGNSNLPLNVSAGDAVNDVIWLSSRTTVRK